MANRFLIALRSSPKTNWETRTNVYPVSERVGPLDVTYLDGTIMFFFLEDTELTREELLTLMFTIRLNNINHIMLNDERFAGIKKCYIPEESLGVLKAAVFGDKVVSIQEVLKQGFFEIV